MWPIDYITISIRSTTLWPKRLVSGSRKRGRSRQLPNVPHKGHDANDRYKGHVLPEVHTL
jgi:hypothetical protein